MFDTNFLFEFSRTYCIPICALLVPANLLATLQTMLWVGLQRSSFQIQLTAAIASLYALLLLMHVLTWWLIGIVMAPTYILTVLGGCCLITNACAVLYGDKIGNAAFKIIPEWQLVLRR